MVDTANAERALPPVQTDFPAEEFVIRRSSVMVAIGRGVALLRGAPATGAFDRFRQFNEFYYLCGVEAPVSYLLIDGAAGRSTLYLPARDPQLERSEGPQLSADDSDLATRFTGVDAVFPLDRLRGDLAPHREIHLPLQPVEGRQACRDTLLHARSANAADPFGATQPEEWLRQQVFLACPGATISDLSPVLDRLRIIKSPRELDVMRRAGRLSAQAVIEAMRCTRPGVMEYELGAIAEYVYLVNGAAGGGYRPIIAGGVNIPDMHYYRNSSPLRDGDLVLMDYAPDVGNYTSDIGRMWPVNGRYAPWQRELYGFVVEYHKVLLGLIKPELTAAEIVERAAAEMAPLMDRRTWSKPAYEQAARKLLQFQGSISHGVGMAVHDPAGYKAGPLQPGMVFALDPQMWVPEENLYIRVEDTVAVTGDGVESLTSSAPLELDDVEQLIKTGPGILGAAAAAAEMTTIAGRQPEPASRVFDVEDRCLHFDRWFVEFYRRSPC